MEKKAKRNTRNFLEGLSKKKFNLLLVATSLLWVSLLAIVLSNTKSVSDDFWFADNVRSLALIEWVTYRWEVWSSRVAPEALLWIFAPESRSFWIAASSIIYALYVFILYKFYLIFKPSSNNKIKLFVLTCISASIWVLSTTVFAETFLWLTGSINYSWMGSLFLLGLYTSVYVLVKSSLPHWIYILLSLIATVIVSISQEQFGLSLVVLNTVFIASYFAINRIKLKNILSNKNLIVLIALTLISLVLFIIVLNAPGNALRSEEEAARWLPELTTIDSLTRAESSIRWFAERLINNSGLVLSAMWALLALGLKSTFPKLSLYFWFLVVMAVLPSLTNTNLAIGSFLSTPLFQYFYEFHASWAFRGGLKSWLPVLFWLVALIITLYGLFKAFSDKKRKIITISLAITAAMTLAALWISPTMYVSGYRVVFASNLLIILLIIVLASNLSSQSTHLPNRAVKNEN